MKWILSIGIPLSVAGGLFAYLTAVGAITPISHSGDTVCAGTLEDPCYAYMNFTANEDIFIYPRDYDPWGRETPFNFQPQLKSWKLQRSWGTGWRNIPLNQSCTGTWCGLSNSNDKRVFSYAFREGRNYSIRIVAYKNNPSEVIKWGAFDDIIDPYWYGTDWIIDGDKVYVNDSRIYMSAEPHTLTKSEDLEINLISKVFTGDVNFVFGFNNTQMKPRGLDVWNPKNITINKNYTCEYRFNYTTDPKYAWCFRTLNSTDNSTNVTTYWNETIFEHSFDTGDILTKTIFWEEQEEKHWNEYPVDPSDVVHFEYQNMTTWRYVKNLPVVANNSYKVRIPMDVITTLGRSTGKYWACIYPSSYGADIRGAQEDDKLYCLDPWWNSSYSYRRLVNCSVAGNDVPLLINGTSGFTINGNIQYIWSVCGGNETAVYYNNYTDYIVANDSLMPFEVEYGNTTSNDVNSVWNGYSVVWHFNESGSAKDSGPSGNTGTVNSATWEMGMIGHRFDIDASESIISVSSSIHNRGLDHSYCGLVTPLDSNKVWVGYGNSVGSFSSFGTFVGQGTSGKINAATYDGSWKVSTSSASYILGKTYWVCVKNDDPNYIELFVNGTSQGQTSANPSLLDREVSIGKGNNEYSDIKIDEYRFYTGLLSVGTINSTYQNLINTEGFGDLGAQETPPGPEPTGNCTCPAAPQNWEINMSNVCNLTTPCHIPGYNVSFVGEGYFNCNSTINCSHFGIPPNNSNIRQSSGCKIQVAG